MMIEAKELRWYVRISFGLITASALSGIILVTWAAIKVLLR